MTILVGADPEVFVKDERGRFRSAHGLVPGTKAEPYPVENGAVQVDGLALEYNIKPASTRDEFVYHNQSVLRQLGEMVPDYSIEIVPTAKFHGNHMRAQPEEALELGCEPDFNAYTEKENPRPNGAQNWRGAGGHVHIGICEGADSKDPAHLQRCITLVKHLDVFLGLPSLVWDRDNQRRKMYGKAGAFRPKPYGVEYRTLSNAWVKHPELMGYVFDQVNACIDFLRSGERVKDRPYRGNPQIWLDNGYTMTEYCWAQYPYVNRPPEVK
jgi:hypothetical protein